MPNIDEDIFRFIYIESMKDAVNQRAYTGERTWLYEGIFDEKGKWASIKDRLSPIIDDVLTNKYESQNDYDEVLFNTAFNICDFIVKNKPNGYKDFAFGNAQKLINMMLKYFYITCYKNESLRENFKFCHCPMDSKMLKNVWKERNKLNFELGTEKRFCAAWGDENFENTQRYSNFQKAVRYLAKESDIYPIEYDYKKWK